MNKRYPLENSPFYGIKNRRKLAEYLHLPKKYFSIEHEYEYNEFSRPKPNGDGTREFAVPPAELKTIQKRICKLIQRIETPEWVMSGKKECSYITNSAVHLHNKFVKTMDISKFYDSVPERRVYCTFLKSFKMEPDIARLMTKLVTYKGALPTGSPSSQVIIYWTYKDMFNKINDTASKRKCIFSLYVDDMTFSSNEAISFELEKEVTNILRSYGLKTKKEKNHYYGPYSFKVITGVGIKRERMVVPNRRRKEIIDLFSKCKRTNDIYTIEKLKGKLYSMRQIEPNIFPEIDNYIKHYEKDLKNISQKRFYKN